MSLFATNHRQEAHDYFDGRTDGEVRLQNTSIPGGCEGKQFNHGHCLRKRQDKCIIAVGCVDSLKFDRISFISVTIDYTQPPSTNSIGLSP